MMNARIEDDNLVIELPLEKPHPSPTGKTLLVASTHGVQRTTARHKGKIISIVANAFVGREIWDLSVGDAAGHSGSGRDI
jgi:hypothetical protein